MFFIRKNYLFSGTNYALVMKKYNFFGSEPGSVQKNVSRIRNKTFYLHFCIRTPEGHQKNIFNISKVKKQRYIIGSIRQSLLAQPKNIKKLSKHQINKSGRTFFQKKYA
jgi:hypothetical protein